MPKNTSSAPAKILTGLGIGALAAAAAATYYFSGKDGKKHLKQAKSWTNSAKKEMLAKIKDMQHLSKDAYQGALKEVLAKYKQAKNVDPKELAAFGAELKQHWESISKHAKSMVNAPKKAPAKRKATKK